jgi:hypothetical protein
MKDVAMDVIGYTAATCQDRPRQGGVESVKAPWTDRGTPGRKRSLLECPPLGVDCTAARAGPFAVEEQPWSKLAVIIFIMLMIAYPVRDKLHDRRMRHVLDRHPAGLA